MNAVNATGGYLIDSCLAVNDAGYIIATGHLDGTDVFDNRTLLLVPDKVPTPSVVTLAATDVTATSATLWAKVNACAKSTEPAFHFGNAAAYGQSFPAPEGAVTGMTPTLRSLALTNLTPNTTYHFRGTAVSSKGTTARRRLHVHHSAPSRFMDDANVRPARRRSRHRRTRRGLRSRRRE